MTEPRIVTPQEAQVLLSALPAGYATGRLLACTVATEPERIAAAERAAVVKALHTYARSISMGSNIQAPLTQWECRERARRWADAIENGAPL